jgi:hypothetical protein
VKEMGRRKKGRGEEERNNGEVYERIIEKNERNE